MDTAEAIGDTEDTGQGLTGAGIVPPVYDNSREPPKTSIPGVEEASVHSPLLYWA